jgi:hypothetical protein
MAYRSLPKFDAEARFIANRALVLNGQNIQPGDLVEGIPERRLRQLYELRQIGVAPALQRKEAGTVVGAARKGKR